MHIKYSWTHAYVDTGALTSAVLFLSIAWFRGPLMTRRFRSTDIHVTHAARFSSCHLIPNTNTHARTATQKILIYHFSISWKLLVIWIVCKGEGSRVVRSRRKTRPLFVPYFYISLFYVLFYPLDFVCSFLLPGWKFMITQVDQIYWKHLINRLF